MRLVIVGYQVYIKESTDSNVRLWGREAYSLLENRKKGDASLNACAHSSASAATPKYRASMMFVLKNCLRPQMLAAIYPTACICLVTLIAGFGKSSAQMRQRDSKHAGTLSSFLCILVLTLIYTLVPAHTIWSHARVNR